MDSSMTKGVVAPAALRRWMAACPGLESGRRRLVVVWGQLGDFDSFEYAQALVPALETIDRSDIALQAIAIGAAAGRDRFCAFTGFPSDRLTMLEDDSLHRELGLHPGLRTGLGPWPDLLLMCAGIASPGTLAEVLRGYSGDPRAPQRLAAGETLRIGGLPPLSGDLFARLAGEGRLRPFELASVRLRNMVEVLGQWRTYVPRDAFLTQRGGTFLVDEEDRLLVQHRDPGLLGFSTTMERPLAFLDPYLR